MATKKFGGKYSEMKDCVIVALDLSYTDQLWCMTMSILYSKTYT